MGFYGNITNTARTQFQFDRTYANRHEMELAMSTDGVYAGRYVLIEYDQEPGGTEFYQELYNDNEGKGRFYLGYGTDKQTEAKYPSDIELNEIVRVYYKQRTNIAEKDNRQAYFYQCIGGRKVEGEEYEIANFKLISDSETAYTNNYSIDLAHYENAGRGWDSTVWQKIYTRNTVNGAEQGVEKYVMIAELNTVVPSFDLEIDAPTMSPLRPHFDSESNNVFYKLHWQPQWGLRVAEAEEDNSDSPTIWIKETYDPSTDKKRKLYFNPKENNWVEYTNFNDVLQEEGAKINAAIYYNAAAFNPQVGETTINKTVDNNNYFTILPTGESGELYNLHDGTGVDKTAKDIQEMRISLPAIGNMMSNAWDIIHGPLRNNARTDENSSLQGRLDSFKEIEGNQIPVKRAADGTLVGSKINGGIAYDEWDKKPIEILKDKTNPAFERDDAWIKTVIDTTTLVGGVQNNDSVNQSSNSGISVHHTFHATENSSSTVDKNTGNTTATETYKEKYIRSANKDHNTDDVIDLYVPYVDAKGHVVGHNIETVTLPYSYRFFKTNAAVDNVKDLYTTIEKDVNEIVGNNKSSITFSESDLTADHTQDTLNINTGNKWIQTKLNDENDELIIAHEIHAIEKIAQFSDLNDNDAESELDSDEITVQDLKFDEAGHVIQNRSHTYRLPFGYKTIKTNGRENNENINNQDDVGITQTVASNTQDTVALNSGNYWTRIDIANDEITLSHSVRDIDISDNGTTNANKEPDADNENNINIPDWDYDAAGHIIEKHDHHYTLPFGFKTIKTNGTTDETTDMTPATADIIADQTQDILTINSHNKWIKIANDTNADSITFAHTVNEIDIDGDKFSNANEELNAENENNINIPDWTYDAAGHITSKKNHYYTLPYGFKTVKTNGTIDNINQLESVSGSLIADSTQDSFTLNTGNKWIRTAIDENNDILTIAHETHSLTTDAKDVTDLNNIGTFTVQDTQYDKAGHITHNQSHTYKLPFNFKTLSVGKLTDTTTEGESKEGKIIADNSVAEFTVSPNNRWITMKADTNNSILSIGHAYAGNASQYDKQSVDQFPNFGASFNIPYNSFDQAGHLSSVSNVKVTLPKALDDNAIVEKTNASVITGIGTNEVGSIITSSADVGTLVLEGYQGVEQGDLVASDSINKAFAKLQNQIHAEKTARKTANDTLTENLNKEIEDRKAAIENVTGEFTKTIASLSEQLETLQSQYDDLLARVIALEANHLVEEEPEEPIV